MMRYKFDNVLCDSLNFKTYMQCRQQNNKSFYQVKKSSTAIFVNLSKLNGINNTHYTVNLFAKFCIYLVKCHTVAILTITVINTAIT